jgi:endonuclease III
MNKKQRFILEKLQELFPSPDIPLQHKDPYTLLIAVLLSAQCTDVRVNLVTPELFALADTPEKMAEVDVGQIEELIKTCGLYKQKASAISRLSAILVKKYGGKVPKTFEELEELPGVGHKTASVVMSQAFKEPSFPVDTHIHRLAKRWGLSEGKNVVQVERDLKKIYPKKYWNILHLQIIYYARKYCPAKGHSLENCPICREVQHCLDSY